MILGDFYSALLVIQNGDSFLESILRDNLLIYPLTRL